MPSAVPTSSLPEDLVSDPPAPTFESCWREHYPRVFRLCLRVTGGNAALSEDVTHDVLLTLLRRWPHLSNQNDLGAWIYKVTIQHALRAQRREHSLIERVRRAFRADPAPSPGAPDALFEERESLAEVQESLRELPPRERAVVWMKVIDGLSQQEIAGALSVSKGYVSKLVTRATARLRERGWQP
jgi:RNA polymerase sigma-70 factor (ECF subfamily)